MEVKSMAVLKELKLKDYITLMGTFCGFFSIILSVQMNAYRAAGGFIFLGVMLDFADGYVARKMNQINELGKQLDSLSDSLVFGVAPSVLIACAYSRPTLDTGVAGLSINILLLPCFIFTTGAILRLAWFNIDKGEGYTGLVTPLSSTTVVLLHFADYYWHVIPGTGLGFANFMKYGILVFLILIAYLNVTPYLIYGKNIRKKTGRIKLLFPIVTVLALLIVILGSVPSALPTTAPYIFAIIMGDLALLFIWLLYGFKNYLELRKSPN